MSVSCLLQKALSYLWTQNLYLEAVDGWRLLNSDIYSMFMLDYPSTWLHEPALWRTWMPLPDIERKIANWVLRDFALFVCLFGFNVALKHLRSYHDGACLWYFDQCAATQKCHAADTGHDTPPRHSIQTRGRPVAVLSIDVERHTGIHSYPF